ncbi:hypothetical protein F1559_004297 [Cyanidiococcus yangmingshanensis]|uniref:Uncharacterized protein n=1 Tax=Cyanidiococcus yangmingshanensis TaxID=2690220 RepID=A0A7J7IMK1_9RHOD|nr:hypothetical protein F1559_004297 [Cyanidiococcus yangmingshanensis]
MGLFDDSRIRARRSSRVNPLENDDAFIGAGIRAALALFRGIHVNSAHSGGEHVSMASLRTAQVLKHLSASVFVRAGCRGLAVRATTTQPVDTSKGRVVAQSALSFQYQLRRNIRKLKEALNDPETKLEVTAADKDACVAEMAAFAKRCGISVTETWLREKVPIADSYTLGELASLVEDTSLN